MDRSFFPVGCLWRFNIRLRLTLYNCVFCLFTQRSTKTWNWTITEEITQNVFWLLNFLSQHWTRLNILCNLNPFNASKSVLLGNLRGQTNSGWNVPNRTRPQRDTYRAVRVTVSQSAPNYLHCSFIYCSDCLDTFKIYKHLRNKMRTTSLC